MVNIQDSAAIKRLSFASLIVLLLSVGVSYGQHDAHDSGDHNDGTTEAHQNDHHDDGHQDAHEANGHAEDGADHHATADHGDGHDSDGHGEKEFNAGEMIMHHIADDYIWHFWDNGVVYLPVILYSSDRGVEVFSSSNFYEHHSLVEYNGYEIHHGKIAPVDESRSVFDISITKNVASLLISIVFMLIIFLKVGRSYKKDTLSAPKGLANFFEVIVTFVRDDIAKPNIGHKYERFMPFLLTLFFFIWFNNLFGLTPGAANLTGNIAVTFTLAIITFIVTNVNGNKNYWKHIFATPGVPIPVLLILVPVEFIGLFTKPFSLMIRLFVSITAGHIVVLSLISLVFIFESFAIGGASLLLVTFINIIELLVATIQAYVFTMFTSMYIGQAVEEHHDH